MVTMNEDQPMRTRRSFTDEFKADAVALVLDEGHRIVDVARDLGALAIWIASGYTVRRQRRDLHELLSV